MIQSLILASGCNNFKKLVKGIYSKAKDVQLIKKPTLVVHMFFPTGLLHVPLLKKSDTCNAVQSECSEASTQEACWENYKW